MLAIMENSCISDNLSDLKNTMGLITTLQDYSVHDGYGLRMIVFLKGCPLRCKWCQNPEAVKNGIDIQYRSALCRRCGECFKVCPVGAIIDPKASDNTTHRIDRAKCTKCGLCVKACRWGALESVGDWFSVEYILNKAERLIPFFKNSGGITVSGGDPVFQPQFTAALLRCSRQMGIHTAIETSGFANYETFDCITRDCDLVLYDIKHMDDARHKWGTGQSNQIILENLARFVRENKTECVVRLPLIPGFNDDAENVLRTALFLASLARPPRLDLLPFNIFAGSKYKIIGLEADYPYADTKRQTDEVINHLRTIAMSTGLEVTTQGLW
jgi:pyruvate formate lyase activating enzyme